MLDHIKLERFTAFEKLSLSFSPGLNIFIGENGCGKTHLLKLIYAACDVSTSQKSFAEKINRVFLPSGEQIGRLVKRRKNSSTGSVEVARKVQVEDQAKTIALRLSMSNHTKEPSKATISGAFKQWQEHPLTSVYIPVKDMMANAPGFRSLYSLRHIHFEEVYADIIDRAFLGTLKGPTDKDRKRLLDILQQSMEGKVVSRNEEFFLKSPQGELEFTLLAEGIRKLGLLWILIQNGTLLDGSVLLWDEPEANLNPRLMRTVVEILIELQRLGVQVFITTHNYNLLKEFDLQVKPQDKVQYHSLFRDADKNVQVSSFARYDDLQPNAIDDTLGALADREIRQQMGELGQ
ncbi:AAA family ATPase [Limnohabitans sp. 2KL-1]|uniref:AAA family ATPase n=1 Tax=Limnohabitans sp. 2KL-1 TaxID=1100699 RepID=UPI000D3448C7|nr:ATP-binding protein [Limnohabitans sp. 2KL-1]PUE48979.1 AAA family ATPase [Limnohabitans sp. 2KL-1]